MSVGSTPVPQNTRIGRLSQVDASTRRKIDAGCSYVNAEVARLKNQVIFAGVLFTLAAAIAYAMMYPRGYTDPRWPIAVAFLLTSAVAHRAKKSLKESYKGIVVRRVVKAIGEGLTYTPKSDLTREQFMGMHLFDIRPEEFIAEDEIAGRKNAVAYSLHEVRAAYHTKGKRRRRIPIFDGVIVRLDFNKHFAGHTIVVQDNQGKMLGGLLGDAESREGKELVRLENPDFEGQFAVYSTDQQQARYLLTPKLMELVMEAQALLGGPLKMSFHDNSLFVTVPDSRDRFEVKLFFGGSVTPESTVGDLVEMVSLAEKLVDVLDLETRIWTRA